MNPFPDSAEPFCAAGSLEDCVLQKAAERWIQQAPVEVGYQLERRTTAPIYRVRRGDPRWRAEGWLDMERGENLEEWLGIPVWVYETEAVLDPTDLLNQVPRAEGVLLVNSRGRLDLIFELDDLFRAKRVCTPT